MIGTSNDAPRAASATACYRQRKVDREDTDVVGRWR